jgi:hypothetical protein
MRKFLILVVFVICIISLFSQTLPETGSGESNKENLLLLSKKQRTIGLLLGSSGVIALYVGVGVGLSHLGNLSDDQPNKRSTVNSLFALGTLSFVGGICILVISGRNQKKALNMTFMLEPVHAPILSANLPGIIPAVQIKIRM